MLRSASCVKIPGCIPFSQREFTISRLDLVLLNPVRQSQNVIRPFHRWVHAYLNQNLTLRFWRNGIKYSPVTLVRLKGLKQTEYFPASILKIYFVSRIQ